MNTLSKKAAFRLRIAATIMTAAATLLLIFEGFTAYADTTPRAPKPYIQNRTNWCWATCAKMVGVRYNSLYKALSFLPSGAVVVAPSFSLKDDGIGYTIDGKPTIDAGQQAIVKYIFGSDVNNPGTKTQTFNAMRYVTNFQSEPKSEGLYYDGSVLRKSWKYPDAALNAGLYVIGNLWETGIGHSVVIQSYNRTADRFTIYDVWNGETIYTTKQKLLTDGFKSSVGTDSITWVYYIINPLNPPKLVDYSAKSYDAVPTGITQDYGSLSDFSPDLSFMGNSAVTGKAPYNYIIYTSVNNGGWYAVRADEHNRFYQFFNFRLKKGDILRMYCESPSGKTTAIQQAIVTDAAARAQR
jgi:hypothetical protein